VVGSRERARAEAVVEDLGAKWGDKVARLRAGTNDEAAAAADLVVLATTWEGAVDTARAHADALTGQDVVAMGNGVEKVDREFRPVLPAEGSLSAAVQRAAPGARVAAAFQHVPAQAFAKLDEPIEGDVVVCADSNGTRLRVLELVVSIPNLRGFDGGSLANALGIEAFAAVLLSINLRHKGTGALRLLGVEGHPAEGRR
jgi:NADPH-dependent F420 reductase